jgi:hypothetical protein
LPVAEKRNMHFCAQNVAPEVQPALVIARTTMSLHWRLIRWRDISGVRGRPSGRGEVEPVVALASGEPGGVAAGAGEGLGRQGGEPAEQFVAVEDPGSVILC